MFLSIMSVQQLIGGTLYNTYLQKRVLSWKKNSSRMNLVKKTLSESLGGTQHHESSQILTFL